jgi:translocator protein
MTRVVNTLVFILLLAFNGAAGSGALSGESIGVIANRHRSLFLPANWVFGIWSLIYIALAAAIAIQLVPGARGQRARHAVGPWWVASSVLNVAWVALFSFSLFLPALAVMVALLVTLIAMQQRVRAMAGAGMAERLCLVYPADLYLAWISVALIANTFQYAHSAGWGPLGLGEPTWAVIMMGVAAALGVIMAARHHAWIFPLVVAWALAGIAVRYATEVPMVGLGARWLAVASVVVGTGAWWWGRRRGSTAAGLYA